MVLLIVLINFFIIHLAPGNPAQIISGLEQPSQEVIKALEHRYGLDKPLVVQLGIYFKNALKGDLGYSYIYSEPVITLIKERIGATLLLTLTSAVLAFISGTLLAAWSSRYKKGILDSILSILSYVLYAMPSFWLALILILIFSSNLRWFPTAGMFNVRLSLHGFSRFGDILYHLFLPVLTLTLIQIPVYFRVTRSSIFQVSRDEYILTMTAAGLERKKIFNKYVLKNAILPSVTIFGLTLGYAITGSALVEIVFAWPGMGRLMLDAVFKRDYNLLLGIYFVLAVCICIAILLTDVFYAILDPRIRYK
ncbi:MAG: ABC transporter permease [Thermotoga sp.]|nr:MAG: ABC transporter permease [Thermotoga sp.]